MKHIKRICICLLSAAAILSVCFSPDAAIAAAQSCCNYCIAATNQETTDFCFSFDTLTICLPTAIELKKNNWNDLPKLTSIPISSCNESFSTLFEYHPLAVDQNQQYDQQTPTSIDQKPQIAEKSLAAEVIDLINGERAAAGLQPLIEDPFLTEAARVRCGEITYDFSHVRPDGLSCFTVLRQAGANYTRAGENIAIGHTSPAQVVKAWMDSPGHRANIMDPNFMKIGVAALAAGEYYGGYAWAQFFTD